MTTSDARSRKATLKRREFVMAGAAAAALIAAPRAGATPSAVAEPPQKKGLQPWWSARPSSPKANRPVSIDMHTHWLPPAYTKALADAGKPVKNINPLEADLDQRRKWMDEHGVQMHLLALSGDAVWQLVTPEQAAHLAQVVNDAAIAAYSTYPDRFVAAIELPITDAALSMKELDRMAGKPGMRAVNVGDTIAGRDYIFEPGFAPVLARCEELGYPLIFHSMNTDPFGKRPAGPGLDAAFTHAVLAAKFITTGTLDKYPKLEIVLPHAGGAFPYCAGRIEHFMYHMGPNAEKTNSTHTFREYLRRFHYDYLTYHPEGLRFLVDLVGADRIVVGTDSFNAKDIEYPSAVVDQFNFRAADRDRILKSNAMRLLHL
ncbi:MAG TPA: amidohydrolase family protein [Candidatus Acidoferrales bacterium]|jgi:aminocarboxymuconate-semialdehyde decarboxylase|nr:amidohydrolase family protein [Candidatus Acidoferrales bacterium]